jgi:hypothetical protein
MLWRESLVPPEAGDSAVALHAFERLNLKLVSFQFGNSRREVVQIVLNPFMDLLVFGSNLGKLTPLLFCRAHRRSAES